MQPLPLLECWNLVSALRVVKLLDCNMMCTNRMLL